MDISGAPYTDFVYDGNRTVLSTCIPNEGDVSPFDESQPCTMTNYWMPHCAQAAPVGIPGSSTCSWGPCSDLPFSPSFGPVVYGPGTKVISPSEWGQGFCPPGLPGCLLPLEAVDNARLDAAMSLIKQTDLVCKVAFDRLRQVRQSGRFYRGNSGIPDGTGNTHDAFSVWNSQDVFPFKIRTGTRATIHVDQDYLRNSAIADAQLAELLVHEGLHFAFAGHAETTSPYTTYPYDLAGSCVN